MKLTKKIFLAAFACSAIVGTGSAQTWQLNGNTQSTALTSDANTSAVAIDPISGQAAVNTAGAPPPQGSVSVSFSASSVNVNVPFTVSWSATNMGSTVTCTPATPSPAAGVSGWPTNVQSGVNGSVQVTINTTGTYTFGLTCTGTSSASGSNSITITPGTGCPSPTLYNTPMTNGGSVTTWAGFFNRDFPGLQGDQGVSTLSGLTYLAAEFRNPTNGFSPDIQLQGVLVSSGGSTKATVGINECPGVVTAATTAGDACNAQPDEPTMEITSEGNNFPFSNRRCRLVKGRLYYFNILQRSCIDVNGQQSTCSTAISVQRTSNR